MRLALELIRWPLAFLVMGGAYVGGLVLRRHHVIVCRTHFRMTFAALVFIDIWIAGTAMWLYGMGNGIFDILWFTGFNLVYPWEPGFRPLWRQMKHHWDHEDDCQYGPRRRGGGAAAKLQAWRKISLNPVFAPT